MKKLVLVGAVLFSSLAFTAASTAVQSEVYICKGKSSKKYHFNQNCRGLSNCSTGAYKVTLKEARNLGRTLCGWED
ncbi:MAG: hypothetical protein WBL21_00190 [Salinimicrobium sp.]